MTAMTGPVDDGWRPTIVTWWRTLLMIIEDAAASAALDICDLEVSHRTKLCFVQQPEFPTWTIIWSARPASVVG